MFKLTHDQIPLMLASILVPMLSYDRKNVMKK